MSIPSEEFREVFGAGSELEGCDFRPHFDGWLLNAFCLVEPLGAKEDQMALVWNQVRRMAEWILARRGQFHSGDRFQLVVGWPEHVRVTARQIVKTGGGFNELARITEADNFTDYQAASGKVVFRSGWDTGIY